MDIEEFITEFFLEAIVFMKLGSFLFIHFVDILRCLRYSGNFGAIYQYLKQQIRSQSKVAPKSMEEFSGG